MFSCSGAGSPLASFPSLLLLDFLCLCLLWLSPSSLSWRRLLLLNREETCLKHLSLQALFNYKVPKKKKNPPSAFIFENCHLLPTQSFSMSVNNWIFPGMEHTSIHPVLFVGKMEFFTLVNPYSNSNTFNNIRYLLAFLNNFTLLFTSFSGLDFYFLNWLFIS